jgi:phage terminase large subunit GpA-like protein
LFRVVVATRLAENFVVHIERMSEPEVLLSRRENYSCEVPEQAKVIVAAIDTHVSWFEYLVVAGAPAVKSGVLRPAPSKAASRPMPKRCIT